MMGVDFDFCFFASFCEHTGRGQVRDQYLVESIVFLQLFEYLS